MRSRPRSTRRGRWRSPPRGRCWRSAGRSCSRARSDDGRPGGAGAGVGRGERAPFAAARAQRDRRDRAHEPRPGAAGDGGARGGRAGGRGLRRTSSSIVGDGRPRLAACARRGAAARADRRRGGVRGQQRRRRRAARRRGRCARSRPRGHRLARAARRDRRRVPRPRGDRAGGRAARRGRDDEPHAAGRLRTRDHGADRRDPARAPVELPPARVRRGRGDRVADASSACR